MIRAALLAATLLALAATTVHADCLNDAAGTAIADACMAGKPGPKPEGLNTADGECSRAGLLKMLGPKSDKLVGYRAGLTNPAAQQRFNANAPVSGMAYADMLLPNGSLVDANFGARPLYEADRLVRVGSEAINTARTATEVLDAVDLRRENRSLHVGDLISVGSFSKLLPPKLGLKASPEFQGLPGNPSIGVLFESALNEALTLASLAAPRGGAQFLRNGGGVLR